MDQASRLLRSTNVSFEPAKLVNAATWALRRLAELGVSIPASNRLELAGKLVRQVLEGEVSISSEDRAEVGRLTEAHWTVLERYTIARVLNPVGDLADLGRKKLRTMLGGPDIAGDEKNSIARDTQFELYVGAMLALGGVSLDLEEPDLTFQYLGTTTGIAAKRVRSPAQLNKRVKGALKQIHTTGKPGFVAVNVDTLIMTGTTSAAGTPLDVRLPTLNRLDSSLAWRPGICGSIVFGHDATWDFSVQRPKLSTAQFNRVRILPANVREKAER